MGSTVTSLAGKSATVVQWAIRAHSASMRVSHSPCRAGGTRGLPLRGSRVHGERTVLPAV